MKRTILNYFSTATEQIKKYHFLEKIMMVAENWSRTHALSRYESQKKLLQVIVQFASHNQNTNLSEFMAINNMFIKTYSDSNRIFRTYPVKGIVRIFGKTPVNLREARFTEVIWEIQIGNGTETGIEIGVTNNRNNDSSLWKTGLFVKHEFLKKQIFPSHNR